MAAPTPVILTNVDFKLDGATLECAMNHLEITPDTTITTLDTMCGSRDYPGNVKWALIATLYQSFDAGSVDETLRGAVTGGVPVTFEVIPFKNQAVSATNPKISGEVIPQDYAWLNGDAGEASTIELEWSLAAPPTFSITDV